jgi:outer membrane protein
MEDFMKKIITTLATLATLTTAANADFLRVEMGAGIWGQGAKEGDFFKYEKDGATAFQGVNLGTTKVTATDESKGDNLPSGYAWAYIKHPLPLIPNLRLEYSSVESNGVLTANGSMYGLTSPDSTSQTNLKLTQMEAIPYYNLLDNTFWLTLDVGLAINIIHYEAVGDGDASYNESGDIPLPLGYLRARVQAPLTNLGAEAIIKYISDGGDNTVSDMLIKVDYTFDIVPFVQPGVEVGYRVMTLKSDITDGDTRTQIDYSFAGAYAGLMLRF